MPGMKLSRVIAARGLEKRQIRRQFMASAAGITVSFWLLALFLMVLKLSGQALGWGGAIPEPLVCWHVDAGDCAFCRQYDGTL